MDCFLLVNFKSYTCLWPSQSPCDPSLLCVCVCQVCCILSKTIKLDSDVRLLENTLILLSLTFWQTLVKGILLNHGWVLLSRGYLVMPADIQTFLVFMMQERCSWYPLGRGQDAVKYPAVPKTVPDPRTMSHSSWNILSVEAEKPWSRANSAPLFIKNLYICITQSPFCTAKIKTAL